MSDMTLHELDLAYAEVCSWYETQARAAVQRGTLTFEEAEHQLGLWIGRANEAERQLKRSCADGGKQDRWTIDTVHDLIVFDSATGLAAHYTQGDECTCKAFDYGNACWHRAAARMIRSWQQHRTQEAERVRSLAVVQATRPARSLAQLQADVDELF